MFGERNTIIISILFLLFFSGFLLGLSIKEIKENVNMPFDFDKKVDLTFAGENKTSLTEARGIPLDRIKQENIKIYNKRVIINVDNAILARFTDTKSMEPVLGKDTNAIEIVPHNITEIKEGDIISYRSALINATIIHRVVEKSMDENGIYLRTKGDNLDYIDPEKIRQEQIERVVVGILY